MAGERNSEALDHLNVGRLPGFNYYGLVLRIISLKWSWPHLEPVEGAVVFDQEVFLFTDGEVVSELAEQVSKMNRLHCYKGVSKMLLEI